MAASEWAPLLQHDLAFSPEQGVVQPDFGASDFESQPALASLLSVDALSDFSVAVFSVFFFSFGAFCAETLTIVKANNSAITDKTIEIFFMRLSLN